MKIPGFTADASLFRSGRQYATSRYMAYAMHGAGVSSAILDRCQSSDGSHSCYCDCGCWANATDCGCMPCHQRWAGPTRWHRPDRNHRDKTSAQPARQGARETSRAI